MQEQKKLKVIAYFDGSCEPRNPGGVMGMGMVIERDGKSERHGYTIPKSANNTNNVAEYLAFEWIVKRLIDENVRDCDIFIYGDSKLVVMQMKGRWRIKSGLYTIHAKRCKLLVQKLAIKNNVFIDWVPREKNSIADDLSKYPAPAYTIIKE